MIKGVFLPSDDLDTLVMIKYLQALLSACPQIKCTSIKADEKLKGFKVKFSEPEEDSVWKEGQITLDNQRVVSIYPLTTTLWISGKNTEDDDSFKEDLTETINQKLSLRILDFERLGKNCDFEKWILKIDAPELDASSIREIDSTLASTLSFREVTVRIWCRKCGLYGHFFRECGQSDASDIAVENKKNTDDPKTVAVHKKEVIGHEQNELSTKSTPVKNGRYSGIRLESIDSYAEKIGEELLKERQEQDLSKTSKNRSTPKKNRTMSEFFPKKFKKEVADEETPQNAKKFKSPDGTGNSRESDEDPAVKEEPVDGAFPTGASTSNMIHSRNSHDDDDDVVVLEDERSLSPGASRDSNFSKPDDSMLPEPSTSFRPDESHSLTSPRPVQKRAKPTTRVEDFSNLSEQLQNCIRHVCDAVKVLEWEMLKAFVTHVKKKSNPLRIALNFTKNTDGLKQQLQAILDRYYSTPQTGTKEDIQFIKWLTGLVDRFDGTIPRKRKPSNKNGDGPPSKK